MLHQLTVFIYNKRVDSVKFSNQRVYKAYITLFLRDKG